LRLSISFPRQSFPFESTAEADLTGAIRMGSRTMVAAIIGVQCGMGRQTRGAIRAYQADSGLPASGEPSQAAIRTY